MEWKDYDYTGDIKYQKIKLTEGGIDAGIDLIVKNYIEEGTIAYSYKKENDLKENAVTITEFLDNNPNFDSDKLLRLDELVKSNDYVISYLQENEKIDLNVFNNKNMENYVEQVNTINKVFEKKYIIK